MNGETICIDANLVVQLVAGTGDVTVDDAWQKWRSQRTRFVAPLLMLYEVTNAIYQMGRIGSMSATDTRRILQSVLAIPIEYQSERRDHERALELAQRFNIRAAYDAQYLALAEREGVEFWTRDERIVNAVRPHVPWVHLVGE